MRPTPKKAYTPSDQPRRSPLEQNSRPVKPPAASEHARGWRASRSLRLGAVATAATILVAIAATSAYASAVGATGSEARLKPISAGSAFVLPPVTQCVKGRQLTVRIRKLPGVRFVSAVVKIDGKPAISVKRAHIRVYCMNRGSSCPLSRERWAEPSE